MVAKLINLLFFSVLGCEIIVHSFCCLTLLRGLQNLWGRVAGACSSEEVISILCCTGVVVWVGKEGSIAMV